MAELNYDSFIKSEIGTGELSTFDKIIYGYIKSADSEYFDDILRYDDRTEVFTELSSLRISTVSWYPFKENANILQLEGGFGAITGALCDRAGKVIVTESSFFRAKAIQQRFKERNNLIIYAGNIRNINFSEKFDYILLAGILGREDKQDLVSEAEELLRNLLPFLKQDGKFLIVENNAYAMKSWMITEGFQRNKQFDRERLQKLVERVGLAKHKFYYPLPSYEFIGGVYTDKCPPSKEIWNYFLQFSLNHDNLKIRESELLGDLISNGIFSFFTNSFFLEAGRDGECSDLESKMVLSDSLQRVKLGINNIKSGDLNFKIFKQMKIAASTLKVDQDEKLVEKVIEVQLDLLKKLRDVCDKYNLELFMMYGTLLGAVREGGLIPGDDDIDVALYRDDYNKLMELTDEFQNEYFLQTTENDNCFYGGYTKLRNRYTTALHPQNWWVECCEGICIDIFPMDYGYRNPIKEAIKRKRICFYQRLLYAKAYGYLGSFKDMGLLRWKTYKYLGLLFSRKQLSNRLNKSISNGEQSIDSPFGIYTHYGNKNIFRALDSQSFHESVLFCFEGIKLSVPINRKRVLSQLYGDNYTVATPWCYGKHRHGFYATDVPYQVYKEKFTGLLRTGPTEQEIILFGDGTLFETYFDRYKNKYRPSRIILMNGIKLVNEIQGIKVERFEEFECDKTEKIYPIIVSIDIREAESMLQSKGIMKYHIFLLDRNWMLLSNPLCVLE